ncbi:extracellular solute-binding protein [Perkinsela sp. CCAP 1560/4]|nr:extracellular solute-binding protein [Perkinsela sp. CCAP 1560/4]|eukprot:KNH07472.1 extracellular solute-binding protein [Perkinsela sp. CCAP 1560/4]
MLSLIFVTIACVDHKYDAERVDTASRTFLATNVDMYQSNERDTFLSFPRGLDRVGRSDGIAALYDARYLSEDPNVRRIELLVLDEICMHKNSATGDPFDIFSDVDSAPDFEYSNDTKPFLDVSAIPLDNVHFEGQCQKVEREPHIEPFPIPVSLRKTHAMKEPSPSYKHEIVVSPVEEMKESSEPTPMRSALMEEIRSTKGPSKAGFVRIKKTRENSENRNSLHAHINQPQSSSAIHSDSFRDAVSFAMQHRRSKLREDSKSIDASQDASGDSYGNF